MLSIIQFFWAWKLIEHLSGPIGNPYIKSQKRTVLLVLSMRIRESLSLFFFVEMCTYERFALIWKKCKESLHNLNLFQSIPPSTDRHQLQNEIISTRIFILLFTLSLTILILYTSLVTVTKTVTIDTPSLTQYSELYSKHSQTLVCPCTQISIKYDRVLSVNYTLHQVCASFLVTEIWFNHLSDYDIADRVFQDDFRVRGVQMFQALSSFCELIRQTISENMIRFYATEYVSGSVTSADLFQSQIETSTQKFRSSLISSFLLSHTVIRNTTQGNTVASAYFSNYNIAVSPTSIVLFPTPRFYSNCSCFVSAQCVKPSSIDGSLGTDVLHSIAGFYMGCYAIEALLQSNLEYFYDRTCIDTLESFLRSSSSFTTEALDSSLPSEYQSNSTINDLLSQLMIEQWNLSVMYEGYYDKCQPAKCVYTYETRNDAIHIVTTLFGLIGGLLTVMKIMIPLSVKLIFYCIRKWSARVTPQIPINWEDLLYK